MKTSSYPGTSLVLIVLTLITGIALGWLFRDLLAGPHAQPGAIAATTAPTTPPFLPSATPQLLPTTLPPTSTTAPAEQPTRQPSVTPVPTEPPVATDEPTVTPVPTNRLPATATPEAPTAVPAPIDVVDGQQITGFRGHKLAEGETLADLAARGGSTPDLISRYNALSGPPQTGRALIVPQLAGQPSELENTPLLVERGRNDRPWVALTLDAGASAAPTPRMLAALRERNIKITFFLTGKWIRDNPELARQIVADGHEIANHTVNHPDLRTLSDEEIEQEIRDTDAIMRETTGVGTRPFFRPPYGAYDQRVLQTTQRTGFLSIYWTLDSLDSVGEPKTPQFLLERVTGKLSAEQLRGAIILAHCGSEPTADALPDILDRFAAMGLEVKKVSEVLGG